MLLTGARQMMQVVTRVAGRAGGVATQADADEIIVGRRDLGMLAKMMRAAGLKPILTGTRPFTLFAPSDAAFEALPRGEVERLLLPAGELALRRLLSHHLAAARWPMRELAGRTKLLETLDGERLLVKAGNQGVRVDTAGITVPDLRAGHGIVHIVDSVMMLD